MADVIVSKQLDFVRLYKEVFPQVAGYIAQQGGSLDEAKDVFQDALIIYYEKKSEEDFILQNTEGSYLFGISRHVWLHKLKKAKMETDLTKLSEPAEENMIQPLAKKLLLLLETAGQKCLDILQSFYYQKQDMEEIKASFGYASARSATVQKYKCLEKVRNEVKQKSLLYEDFFE
jgi:DNA-directed RNA polymerase specialized sigma24 family protein